MSACKIFLFLIVLVAVCTTPAASVNPIKELKLQSQFMEFLRKFAKSYRMDEFFERFNAFARNVERILTHDAKAAGYEVGLNNFADMFENELLSSLGQIDDDYELATPGNMTKSKVVMHRVEANEEVPDSVDWRHKGVVTNPRQQGLCGSCWTFAAAGAIESAYAIATGDLPTLSTQELLECVEGGCDGGNKVRAMEWVRDNGGLASDEDYKYWGLLGDVTHHDRTCKKDEVTPSALIKEVRQVKPYDEEALKAAVAKSPVAVSIHGSDWMFQLYVSGVYSGCDKNAATNHAVVIVGYGTDHSRIWGKRDYWIIKNSWGSWWGQGGYGKILRGKNMCQIASRPYYPVA